MNDFAFHKGVIVTFAQKDKIPENDLDVEVMPGYKYLLTGIYPQVQEGAF